MPQLDLTLLATGYRQIVFTLTDDPAGPWVYKIPAAFGHVMPYPKRQGPPRPITSFKQALVRVIRTTPLPGLLSIVREWVFLAHFRRARAKNFLAMLALLEDLSRHGLDDVTLSFRRILPETEATLRVNGTAIPYYGPILVQQRVTTVFSKQTLERFDWQELIDAQHRLWRKGFGLTEKGEVLGYRSWALVNGHVRLADTSSLTTDYGRARRPLTPTRLDQQEQRVLNHHQDSGMQATFREYFRFIRGGINQETFDALWRVDLNGGGPRSRREP